MNRKHKVEDYLDIFNKLKKINPLIRFSSDFIIGYPGEEQDDFDQTINLVKEIRFINSFSFIFSSRPGTPAFSLKEVDKNETKDRLTKFQQLADKIKTNYRESLINKNVSVLFENMIKGKNKYFGRDEFFNSVIIESDENLIGKIRNIKILKVNQNTLFGEINSNLNQTNFAA